MTAITYEVSGEGDVNAAELAARMRTPNSTLFRARREWERTAWQAYTDGLLHHGNRSLRFQVDVFTMDSTVLFHQEELEIPLNTEFFNAVVLLYGTHGWAGIAAMQSALGGHIEHTRRLVEATVGLLESLVARELLALEAEATTLALSENQRMLDGVYGYLGEFEWDAYHRSWRLGIEQKDALYEKLKEAHRLQRTLASLGKKIQERNRKDGGNAQLVRGKRERDAYRRLLLDIYLTPQRKHIAELESVQEQMATIFMPALLILNELDDDILKRERKSGRMDSLKAEVKFDARMYAALAELLEQLKLEVISLSNPGMSSTLFRHLSRSADERVKAGGIHRVTLDKLLEPMPSVRDFVQSAALQGGLGLYYTFEARQKFAQTNRVLCRPAILGRLQQQVVKQQPGSFRQAVLLQFRLDLDREIEAMAQRDALYESVWHWVEVCLALAGLLLAALAIPFGPGAVAVPVALTTVLAVAGMATCVLSVVLMVRGLLGLFETTDTAGGEIRKALLELGQLNREAFIEVGQLVVRKHELFKGATTGLVMQVITLAVAHKLKPVAFALEMQGNLDDMETLGVSF